MSTSSLPPDSPAPAADGDPDRALAQESAEFAQTRVGDDLDGPVIDSPDAAGSAAPVRPALPSDEPSWPLIMRWLLLAAALAFGAWGVWTVLAPTPDGAPARLRAQATHIEALEQQVATLSRSDQISRDANRDVQGTLAERDEEISALRADVAFYERFVGATGQRRGLTVHELRLQPQSDTAWHFTATLTQNLNRGAVSSGTAALAVEGMLGGKLKQLDWVALRQQAKAPGVAYSFKYFQQVEGDIALPAGFQPLRVSVRLSPQGGAAIEKSIAWAAAADLGVGE